MNTRSLPTLSKPTGTGLGHRDPSTQLSQNGLSSNQRGLLFSLSEVLSPHIYLFGSMQAWDPHQGPGGWRLNLRNCLFWTAVSNWRPFSWNLVMAETSHRDYRFGLHVCRSQRTRPHSIKTAAFTSRIYIEERQGKARSKCTPSRVHSSPNCRYREPSGLARTLSVPCLFS